MTLACISNAPIFEAELFRAVNMEGNYTVKFEEA